MDLGDTFVNRNVGSPDHLWIICSPQQADDAFLMFNLTSRAHALDEICIVHVGEHPFVTHESVIEYERGRLLTPYVIQILQARNEMEVHEPASRQLIRKIQLGALASDFTARKFKAIINTCLIPEDD